MISRAFLVFACVLLLSFDALAAQLRADTLLRLREPRRRPFASADGIGDALLGGGARKRGAHSVSQAFISHVPLDGTMGPSAHAPVQLHYDIEHHERVYSLTDDMEVHAVECTERSVTVVFSSEQRARAALRNELAPGGYVVGGREWMCERNGAQSVILRAVSGGGTFSVVHTLPAAAAESGGSDSGGTFYAVKVLTTDAHYVNLIRNGAIRFSAPLHHFEPLDVAAPDAPAAVSDAARAMQAVAAAGGDDDGVAVAAGSGAAVRRDRVANGVLRAKLRSWLAFAKIVLKAVSNYISKSIREFAATVLQIVSVVLTGDIELYKYKLDSASQNLGALLDHTVGTASFKCTDCKFNLSYIISFELDMKDYKVQRFKSTIKGDLLFTLDSEVGAKDDFNWAKEVPLAEYAGKPWVFMAGPIPFVLQVKIDFDAFVNVAAGYDVSLTTGTTLPSGGAQAMQACVGGSGEFGVMLLPDSAPVSSKKMFKGFHFIRELSLTGFGAFPKRIDATAFVTSSVGVRMTGFLKIDVIGGPTVSIVPYVEATIAASTGFKLTYDAAGDLESTADSVPNLCGADNAGVGFVMNAGASLQVGGMIDLTFDPTKGFFGDVQKSVDSVYDELTKDKSQWSNETAVAILNVLGPLGIELKVLTAEWLASQLDAGKDKLLDAVKLDELYAKLSDVIAKIHDMLTLNNDKASKALGIKIDKYIDVAKVVRVNLVQACYLFSRNLPTGPSTSDVVVNADGSPTEQQAGLMIGNVLTSMAKLYPAADGSCKDVVDGTVSLSILEPLTESDGSYIQKYLAMMTIATSNSDSQYNCFKQALVKFDAAQLHTFGGSGPSAGTNDVSTGRFRIADVEVITDAEALSKYSVTILSAAEQTSTTAPNQCSIVLADSYWGFFDPYPSLLYLLSLPQSVNGGCQLRLEMKMEAQRKVATYESCSSKLDRIKAGFCPPFPLIGRDDESIAWQAVTMTAALQPSVSSAFSVYADQSIRLPFQYPYGAGSEAVWRVDLLTLMKNVYGSVALLPADRVAAASASIGGCESSIIESPLLSALSKPTTAKTVYVGVTLRSLSGIAGLALSLGIVHGTGIVYRSASVPISGVGLHSLNFALHDDSAWSASSAEDPFFFELGGDPRSSTFTRISNSLLDVLRASKTSAGISDVLLFLEWSGSGDDVVDGEVNYIEVGAIEVGEKKFRVPVYTCSPRSVPLFTDSCVTFDGDDLLDDTYTSDDSQMAVEDHIQQLDTVVSEIQAGKYADKFVRTSKLREAFNVVIDDDTASEVGVKCKNTAGTSVRWIQVFSPSFEDPKAPVQTTVQKYWVRRDHVCSADDDSRACADQPCKDYLPAVSFFEDGTPVSYRAAGSDASSSGDIDPNWPYYVAAAVAACCLLLLCVAVFCACLVLRRRTAAGGHGGELSRHSASGGARRSSYDTRSEFANPVAHGGGRRSYGRRTSSRYIGGNASNRKLRM